MKTTKPRKITFEEHFMTPGFEGYSKSFIQHMKPEMLARLSAQLSDFDELRLSEMDRYGIDFSILSQTGPGVQGEQDLKQALAQAQRSNDYLAQQVQRHPTRFGGFASLPMHDPKLAAAELTRAVKDLGFKGALVNGHTQGRYYDGPAYDEFWACMQELDVPFYLHPSDAYVFPQVFDGHPEMRGAAWGWGVETASHALRLLFGGVFDRFPDLKVILGHMGEGLPFIPWRLDNRFAVYPHGVHLERAPSEYIGSNILVTTSGVCSPSALKCALAELGTEAVMFSVDYPYESTAVAVEFIDSVDIDEEVRAQICHGNAEHLFKL